MLGMYLQDHDSIEFTVQQKKWKLSVGERFELSRERPCPYYGRGFYDNRKNVADQTRDGERWSSVGDVKGKVLHARYSRYMQQLVRLNQIC